MITPISSISNVSSVSPFTINDKEEFHKILPSVSIVSKPSSGVAEQVILLYLQNSFINEDFDLVTGRPHANTTRDHLSPKIISADLVPGTRSHKNESINRKMQFLNDIFLFFVSLWIGRFLDFFTILFKASLPEPNLRKNFLD